MRFSYLGRRANDQITLLEEAKIRTCFARQADNLLAALQVPKLLAPFLDALVDHLLIRLDANRPLLLALAPEPQEREFRADCLTASRRRSDEDVVVRGVESLEDLGLDLVERLDSRRVDTLELFVVQRGERKSLKVEEGSRGRELLGKNEVLE